jgi:hypothetical protein
METQTGDTEMTKARYNAKHENGAEWQLVAKPQMAANFARNYCKRERIPGLVSLTDTATGEVTTVQINSDYSI